MSEDRVEDIVEDKIEDKVFVSKINTDRLKKIDKGSRLSRRSLGRGKILLTIDKILASAAAIFEIIRELPGFEYLKAIEIGRLTTWFNTRVGLMTAEDPNNVYSVMEAIDKSKDGIGMLFSAIVEFVIQHPTVTVLGVTTCLTILSLPFKALVRAIREMKEKKEAKKKEGK